MCHEDYGDCPEVEERYNEDENKFFNEDLDEPEEFDFRMFDDEFDEFDEPEEFEDLFRFEDL